GSARDVCFESIGSRLNFLFWPTDPDYTYCATLSDASERLACTHGDVRTLIDRRRFQTAVNYCALLGATSERSYCYNIAFQTVDRLRNQPRMSALCEQSRSPDICMTGLK